MSGKVRARRCATFDLSHPSSKSFAILGRRVWGWRGMKADSKEILLRQMFSGGREERKKTRSAFNHAGFGLVPLGPGASTAANPNCPDYLRLGESPFSEDSDACCLVIVIITFFKNDGELYADVIFGWCDPGLGPCDPPHRRATDLSERG